MVAPVVQALLVTPLTEQAVVGLGSNLGDARGHLLAALEGLGRLHDRLGLRLVGVSPLYRTAPWQTEGPDFLNAVAVLEGAGDEQAPQRLLSALLELERTQGRERPFRYAPRTLDLDLILFGQRVMDTAALQLPHPRALQRAFVLQPLLDLAPHMEWPGLGCLWRHHLDNLHDPAPQPLDDPDWPALPMKR